MKTKNCCMCQRDLPVSEFAVNSQRKDGLQSQCKECQKAYRRQHYLDNRQKYIDKAKRVRQEFVLWFQQYKATLKCKHCPEREPCCLDFHHNSDDKEANVATLVHKGNKERLLKEIAKCDVVCANCHRKIHAGKI